MKKIQNPPINTCGKSNNGFEKSNNERERRDRKKAVNSGHLVMSAQ